jgi:hypothetical protein
MFCFSLIKSNGITALHVFFSSERTLSYIRVIKIPVYVCTLTFNILNWSAIVGKFSFLTKYISAQYGVPLWKANIIMCKYTDKKGHLKTLHKNSERHCIDYFLQCAYYEFI